MKDETRKVYAFRISEAEKELFTRAAEREGMVLSQWLRWIALKAAKAVGVTKSGTTPTV